MVRQGLALVATSVSQTSWKDISVLFSCQFVLQMTVMLLDKLAGPLQSCLLRGARPLGMREGPQRLSSPALAFSPCHPALASAFSPCCPPCQPSPLPALAPACPPCLPAPAWPLCDPACLGSAWPLQPCFSCAMFVMEGFERLLDTCHFHRFLLGTKAHVLCPFKTFTSGDSGTYSDKRDARGHHLKKISQYLISLP